MTVFRKGAFTFTAALALGGAPCVIYAEDAQIRGTLDRTASGAGLASACTSGSASCLVGIVGQVIAIVLGLLGIALLCYLIYAGILWMTAGGEKEQIKEAQAVIKNTLIGLVIIGLSYALANFVVNSLGSSFSDVRPTGPAPVEEPTTPTEGPNPFRYGCARSTCMEECTARDACASLPASRQFNCESSCQTRCNAYCTPTGSPVNPTETNPSRCQNEVLQNEYYDRCRRERCGFTPGSSISGHESCWNDCQTASHTILCP